MVQEVGFAGWLIAHAPFGMNPGFFFIALVILGFFLVSFLVVAFDTFVRTCWEEYQQLSNGWQLVWTIPMLILGLAWVLFYVVLTLGAAWAVLSFIKGSSK